MQSKYKYDIRNQRVKLYINDVLSRIFGEKSLFWFLRGTTGRWQDDQEMVRN